MSEFRDQGKYCFEKFDVPGFSSSTATDSEIPFLIKKVLNEHDYLIDPHTACGFKDLGSEQTSVVLATAHPAKFPSVYEKGGWMFLNLKYWIHFIPCLLENLKLMLIQTLSSRSF